MYDTEEEREAAKKISRDKYYAKNKEKILEKIEHIKKNIMRPLFFLIFLLPIFHYF